MLFISGWGRIWQGIYFCCGVLLLFWATFGTFEGMYQKENRSALNMFPRPKFSVLYDQEKAKNESRHFRLWKFLVSKVITVILKEHKMMPILSFYQIGTHILWQKKVVKNVWKYYREKLFGCVSVRFHTQFHFVKDL